MAQKKGRIKINILNFATFKIYILYYLTAKFKEIGTKIK
jgi:hypothetical protein